MATGLLLQYAVIALAALVSAWVVVKKQFPGTVRRVRTALALALLRPQRAPWLPNAPRYTARRCAAC